MSDQPTPTMDDLLEELEVLQDVYDAAANLCEYAVEKMNGSELGLASSDPRIAIEFLDRLKALIQAIEEDDDGAIQYEYEQHDSPSGSSEADSWAEGGDVRPGNGKLH